MAAGYAALANGGFRVTPYFIDRVVDRNGKVLFQANPERVCHECEAPATASGTPADTPAATPAATPVATEITGSSADVTVQEPPAAPAAAVTPAYPVAPRIMSARTAYQMRTILHDVIVHGTGRAALALGRGDLGGKTGTTNDAKDAWFSGFGGGLVAVAWLGFDQPQTLGRVEYGGYAALPLWNAFMGPALAGVPEYQAPVPPGLVPVHLNLDSGQRTTDDDPRGYTDWIQAEKLSTLPAATAPAPGAPAQVAPEDLF
jgi:penicillin-binding protein 1A